MVAAGAAAAAGASWRDKEELRQRLEAVKEGSHIVSLSGITSGSSMCDSTYL